MDMDMDMDVDMDMDMDMGMGMHVACDGHGCWLMRMHYQSQATDVNQ